MASVTSPTANGGLVMMNGGMLTYTPASGYFGNDTINYVLTDGCGSAAGAISVTVLNANTPPANVITIQMSGGNVLLQFHGIPNQAYYIQVASSLAGPWTDLPGTPLTASSLGLVSLTVSPPTSPSYYRVSTNP